MGNIFANKKGVKGESVEEDYIGGGGVLAGALQISRPESESGWSGETVHDLDDEWSG